MQKYYHVNSLTVDVSFRDFLSSSHNKINRMILCVETENNIDFISTSDKPDMISYLPSSKIEKTIQLGHDPFSEQANRSRMKIGRLITKLYSKRIIDEFNVTPSDIEAFVNSFKSFFDIQKYELRVIEGDEIKKWYLYDTYMSPEIGTLWKSCMRYKEKQPFLNLYANNPDVCKMLIMVEKNEDGQQKLRGRALLWQDVKSETSTMKVMDRIYTIFDSDVLVFKRWARENGYMTKAYQNSKTQDIFDIDGSQVQLFNYVELKNFNLESYPYLDTFQYFEPCTGKFFNYPSMTYQYRLNRANGQVEGPVEEADHEDVDLNLDTAELYRSLGQVLRRRTYITHDSPLRSALSAGHDRPLESAPIQELSPSEDHVPPDDQLAS